MGYECLLTGLPDIKAGGEAPMAQDALLVLLDEALTDADKRQLDLLRLRFDDELIRSEMQAYDDTIIGQPFWWEDAREVLSEEDLLTALLYEYGKKKGNRFLKLWFTYNQDLNNILAAAICRKHGFDVRRAIVGENEVAQILRRNPSAR